MTDFKLSCAIVDDEPLAVRLLESYVDKTPFLEKARTYGSAVEAIGSLQASPVDILFLDIQMPELGGLDLAPTIPAETRIVFTTAFSQYAIDGYKVRAVGYLLKPIAYADFLGAAQRVLDEKLRLARVEAPTTKSAEPTEDVPQPTDSFFIKSDYKLLRIRFDDVLYVEGLKDYVKIYLSSQPKPILSLTAMHAVEKFLPPSVFMRTHRSFIVNMQKVTVLERGQIVFGDKRIPVSDSYREAVQAYVGKSLLAGRGGTTDC